MLISYIYIYGLKYIFNENFKIFTLSDLRNYENVKFLLKLKVHVKRTCLFYLYFHRFF